MKDGILSKTDIKELTNFLPLLYDENIELSKSPKKGTTDLWGGFYVYHPTVNTFFELASQEHWKDYQYVDNFSDRMIKPGEIEKASIYEIKTILTWCVRKERFQEGHWISVIEDNVINRILKRLYEILESELIK